MPAIILFIVVVLSSIAVISNADDNNTTIEDRCVYNKNELVNKDLENKVETQTKHKVNLHFKDVIEAN